MLGSTLGFGVPYLEAYMAVCIMVWGVPLVLGFAFLEVYSQVYMKGWSLRYSIWKSLKCLTWGY